MKKIKKISLHNLSQAELQNREMLIIKGGVNNCACVCACDCLADPCSCQYAAPDSHSSWNPDYYGGSSSNDNHNAHEMPNEDSITNSATYSVGKSNNK